MMTAEVPATCLAYDRKGAAAQLSVGEFTVRALLRRGELRAVRVGKRDLIPHSELEDYLARRLAELDRDTT